MLDVTGESSYPFVMSSPVDSLDDDTFVSVGEAANKVVEKLKEARMDRQTRPGMASGPA